MLTSWPLRDIMHKETPTVLLNLPCSLKTESHGINGSKREKEKGAV